MLERGYQMGTGPTTVFLPSLVNLDTLVWICFTINLCLRAAFLTEAPSRRQERQ